MVILNDDLMSKEFKEDENLKPRVDFEIPGQIYRFANGEVKAEILQAVRGSKDVYHLRYGKHLPIKLTTVTDFSVSVNDHIMFCYNHQP